MNAPPHVIVVFDPERRGADFAYTTGLADELGYELHVWARPTEGPDPGDDWILSPKDRTWVLGDAAERLRGGTVRVGESFTVPFDDDATTVTFTVTAPKPAPAHDTHQLDAGTPVVTLRWSLHRPPAGDEDAPVPAEAHARNDAFVTWLADTADARAAYWGYRPETETAGEPWWPALPDDEIVALRSWAVPLERARRTLGVLCAQPAWELVTLGPYQASEYLRYALGVLQATARRCGRQRPLAAALNAAVRDARIMYDDDPEAHTLTAHALGTWYGAIIVADELDDAARAAAGGWLDACLDPNGATERFCAHTDRVLEPGWAETAAAEVTGSAPIEDDGNTAWIPSAAVAAHHGLGAPMTARWAGGPDTDVVVPPWAVQQLVDDVLATSRRSPDADA